jgi:hypothetical protein
MFAEHVAAYLDQSLVERPDEMRLESQAVPGVMPEPLLLEPDAIEPAVPAPVVIAEAAQPEMVAEAAQPEVVETEAFVALPLEPMGAVAPATYDDNDNEGLWLLTRSPQVIEFGDQPAAPEPDTLPLRLLPPLPPARVLTLPREVMPVGSFEVVFEPPEVITIRDDAADTRALRRAVAAAVSVGRGAATTAPVQDEWGLFDPNKCGFSALLDKLDEMTDDDRQSTAQESSVRLVTHY